MKIKNYTSQIIAMLTLVFLVAGFQIKIVETNAPISLKSVVGVETAYAGPCGAAGCVGKIGYCGKEVIVVKVLSWELRKECHGKDESSESEPATEPMVE